MNCPKCDLHIAQPDADECPSCGVVLSKASRHSHRQAFPRPQAPPERARVAEKAVIPWSKLLRIGIVVVAIWYGWQFVAGRRAAASWYHGTDGYERAVAEQKSTSRPIILHFYTDWCGVCKRLDREVLSTAKFGNAYRPAIKVKVNPEKDGQAAGRLAVRYAIRGFPTVLVVPPGGRATPIVGYGNSEGFYTRVSAAIAGP
ncbi:MAG TPA: thioredoxin family protein [Thermoanaerobaculia bacterium]|nr:thioredoxin family protein [Thermoanaerobaculia bacterium]